MKRLVTVRHQQLQGKPSPKKGDWSQSLICEAASEEAAEARGKLFAIADISAPDSFDTALAGKLILNSLEEGYYSSLEGSPLQALEQATLAAHHCLIDLTLGPRGAGSSVDFNLVAAALWGQVLYISKLGTVTATLLRGGKTQEIGESEVSKVLISSGLVKDGDILILGNRKFKEKFSKTYLQNHLGTLEQQTSELLNSPPITGVILSFNVGDTPGEEETIRFTPDKEKRKGKKAVLNRLNSWKTALKAKLLRPPSPTPKKPSRHLPALILIVGLLFSASTVFTLVRHRKARIGKEGLDLLAKAGANLETASGLIDLNNERARELALEAETDLNLAKSLGASGQVDEMLVKAGEVLGRASRITTLNDPKLVYNLTIRDLKANPKAIAGTANALFIADPGANTIHQLNLTDPVTVEDVAVENFSSPRLIYISEETAYVLGEDELISFNTDTKTVTKETIDPPDNWPSVSAVVAFFDNLYLLDATHDQIVKYSALGAGFSSPQNWIAGQPDLPLPVDIAIDGDVFVLSQNGQVFKYTQGERGAFSFSGLALKLSSPIKLFTHKDMDELYILDRGNKRVVVTSKEGVYLQQYMYKGTDSSWEDLRDFWIKEGKMFILAGTRIYKVPLGE